MSQPATAFYEKVLAKYGLATLLALWFFYYLTSDVSGTMQALKAQMGAHTADTAYYLRAICLRVSKDEAERAGCVPPQH